MRESTKRTWAGLGAATGLLWGSALPVAAQRELTLEQALSVADERGYANRIAAGEVRTQEGASMQALRGILPTVRLEAGWQETTDPTGAFGITLRQRAITAADFDPALLNDPEPTSNWTGAVVLEQPLLNADAWLGRRAAERAVAARRAAEAWTERATRADVVSAYFGAVLAEELVATLETGLTAAQAHVRQAESLAGQGVVTRSDALLTSVHAGEIEASLAEARGNARLARRGLAVLLGAPEDTGFTLPARLPADAAVAELAARIDANQTGDEADVAARADVRAAAAGAAAARLDRRRAASLWLPRLNGIARLDWNSPDAPFDAERNWSVGVMATWTPVAGASQLAELRAASGRLDVAEAQAEAARAQAELDVAARTSEWRVALERLAIAARAVEQSEEARRIVERKYEGGLATVVELLGASASATESRLRESQARYEAIAGAAALLQSLGLDPALLGAWVTES